MQGKALRGLADQRRGSPAANGKTASLDAGLLTERGVWCNVLAGGWWRWMDVDEGSGCDSVGMAPPRRIAAHPEPLARGRPEARAAG